MLKHIGLSLSLCLLAMGLNNLLVTSSDAQQQTQQSAQNVTNALTTLIEQGSYINHDGYSVRRTAHTVSGAAPTGASAQCRDASYSFSMNHRGTCSRHCGVARWL
ncbi:DUF3761 domain-containing protein [Rhodanobacter sp. A1T4]|uniref:DUF3761 domain-containing protein n=1 Tax=Rhodanobacter sp. A1T4 TaxID=2723087 RepID=UPI0017C8D77D|nr:DUF3761 domain-containing protein [Rhodanobacter sp. A1T4]MBB6249002.1 hypothetical protein [Rhodanobacter sp. A1T4]